MDEPAPPLSPPVVATSPEPLFLVGTLMVGAGVGLMLFRLLSVVLSWSAKPSFLYTGIALACMMGGGQLSKGRRRPHPVITVLVALVGIGLSLGAARLMIPTLRDASLQTRALPGFSISLPEGVVTESITDYQSGKVGVAIAGQARSVVQVVWAAGATDREGLTMAAKVLMPSIGASGGTTQMTTVPGPQGAPVDTVVLDTDKGVPLRMSAMACGKRTIYVTSLGVAGIDALHGRILRSVTCTPDAAKENVVSPLGTIRLAVELPGYRATEKLQGQIQLVDPTGATTVLMFEQANLGVDLTKFVTPLLSQMFTDAKVSVLPNQGDYLPFSIASAEGTFAGWITTRSCPTYEVIVLVIGDAPDHLDSVRQPFANAHCLGPTEAAPTWPDATP